MNPFRKDKTEDGMVAIDGNFYTDEQYRICTPFVRTFLENNGYTNIFINPWMVTGAIAGFAWKDGKEIGVEFYMYDLSRGILRNGS